MSVEHFSTLKAVASKAGVSTATASFVLNGIGERHRISAATQKRVRKAAEELKYLPNPLARHLRKQQTMSIGVLWGFSGPHLSNSLVQCFTTSAMDLGYSALVYDTAGTLELIKTQLHQLLRWRVQGAIMLWHGTIAERPDSEILELLQRIPCVLLAVEAPLDLPFPQIVQSRRKAMADAVRYFVESGRRHFAYIGAVAATRSKITAIQAALSEHPGVSSLHLLNHPQPNKLDPELLRPLLDELLEQGVDAVFTTTDEMAALAIGGLRLRGLRIPEDIAVVGFNDSPFASIFVPPIASIRRFDSEVCIAATHRLIGIIENPKLKKQPPPNFEMEFVLRQSAQGGAKGKHPMPSCPPPPERSNGTPEPLPVRSTKRLSRSTAGFTLLEVLAVISIILLLTVIALPAFSAVRKRGDAARCVGNLRQIGLAMTQYAADNQNCLPLNVYPGNSWHTKVDSYLGCDYRKIWDDPELVHGTALLCPDEKRRPLTAPYATYAINRELFSREGNDNPPKEIAVLANPSKYVVMSDGHDAVIYTDRNQKMVEWTQITRYHGGRPNFLYADWHVENFSGPIVGLMDPGGQQPENRMRWEARYVAP